MLFINLEVPASEDGKGQIVVEHAADNSHITVQGEHSGNTIDEASYKRKYKP